METVLYELPVPSTSLLDAPEFWSNTGEARLTFRLIRDGEVVTEGFVWHRVRGFRARAEGHSTTWHLAAYDKLIEVTPSEWVRGLLQDSAGLPWKWPVRHFMIFLDGSGAFEVAAESCDRLPAR